MMIIGNELPEHSIVTIDHGADGLVYKVKPFDAATSPRMRSALPAKRKISS